MARKKPPNWEDIKTRRTVLGQSWEEIQRVYDVALSTLRNRASREAWKYEAVKIGTEIREAAIEQEKIIDNLVGELIQDVLEEYREARKSGLSGLTVQDGEGFPNRLAEHCLKAGLASYLERRKQEFKLSAPGEEEEPPGFHVSRDV